MTPKGLFETFKSASSVSCDSFAGLFVGADAYIGPADCAVCTVP